MKKGWEINYILFNMHIYLHKPVHTFIYFVCIVVVQPYWWCQLLE